jgi:hypothetical protein
MRSPMPSDPHHAAAFVGAVTTVAGGLLVASPEGVGRRAWIERPTSARILGAVDLALVPGLVAGRPRWPWMAARVAANLGTAAFYERIARRGPARIGPRAVAGTLLALSVADASVVRTLRRVESD